MLGFTKLIPAVLLSAVIGLLALAVQAPPAAAAPLVIGTGWTADEPAGVSYGAVTGAGTSANSYTFDLNLSSAAGISTTIHFVNDAAEADQTYFNLTLKGTNTGAPPWTGMKIAIVDKANQVDLNEGGDHPAAAHVHRSSWSEANSTHFKCVDAVCTFPGLFDMTLGLKGGATPITQTNTTTGSKLRLHDVHEAGGDANPMKFDLIFTPLSVPEPGAFMLFGSGMVGLIGVARRKRRAVQ